MHKYTLRGAVAGALLIAAAVPAIAARTSAPKKPAIVTITATDYAFDAPDTIVAGATVLQLVNHGKEMHHVQMVRLDSGKTFNDMVQAMQKPDAGPPPRWIVDVGGPNAAAPGGAASVTAVNLEPGNYVILCFIPSPDGTPHAMKGMSRTLTVVPATGGAAAMPATDAAITLKDYGFEFARPLTAGKHDVLITNAAAQAHEILFVKLAPGKTTQDLAAWVEKMDGPPPAMPMGGTSGIAPGGSNIVSVELTPGEYGLLCFLPDMGDGKPHVAHGMMRQFTIK